MIEFPSSSGPSPGDYTFPETVNSEFTPRVGELRQQRDSTHPRMTDEFAGANIFPCDVEQGRTPIKTRRPKVLVADDEQVIANTLTIILNQSGFEACAVYSGEDALEILPSFQPDVLISDVMMTGITGIETAMAVRAQRPNCKILLFSGQAATADLLQNARIQGHHFELLAKPLHPVQLLAKLRTTSDCS